MGAAFEQCEAGMFFVEMIKRISQQKYDESQRQEYLDKQQTEEEETRRAHADKRKRKQEYLDKKQTEEEETRRAQVGKMQRKQEQETGKWQEYLSRKQESGEDTREYNAAKEELWLQAYAPNKRNLVEFKDEMLKRLYNEELRKHVCVSCLRYSETLNNEYIEGIH